MIKKSGKVSTEINSAPMSDINFLLLIFFLVTTMFAVEEGCRWPCRASSQNRLS